MFDSLPYLIVLAVLLFLLSLAAPPLLAARKGYAWYLWTTACGLLGLIILAFLPYANKSDSSPDVNQSRRQMGNTIGAVLSVIGLLGILFQVIYAVAAMGNVPLGEAGTSFLWSQLGYHAPVLLVYLIAFVLALVYMGRASIPSTLTLVGVGILLISAIGGTAVQAWLIDTRLVDGRESAGFAQLMRSVGIAATCATAVGLSLLVAAIFVGRSRVKDLAEPLPRPTDVNKNELPGTS